MARTVSAFAAAVALLLVAAVVATPTTPFVSNAYLLPYSYLHLNPESRARKVTNRSIEPDSFVVAKAQFNRSMYDLGWDYLNVEGKGDYNSGYLEGYLTADRIVLAGIPAAPTGKVQDWVVEHMQYMRNQSTLLGSTDSFWRKVGDMLDYILGMTDGVNAALPSTNATYEQIFLISFGPEIGDVQTHVSVMEKAAPKFRKQHWKPSHCSAMIKVTQDDLYMAHDTWDSFSGMAYRIYKVYTFDDATVVFTAHPAFIASTDDWYMTSKELAIQETTNDVMNLELFKAVVPHTVSEFLRVMAATFLAYDGEEWTRLFSRENSGTYNNQYMVVDYKRYAPGSSIAPGTLWIAEQLPGLIARGDVSDVLASTGYWASYNIPYFPEIYNISGYLEDYEIYGDFYSYTAYARPEIFKRNSTMISTLQDMMRMMRFNHYQVDPFSKIHNCTGAPNNQCLTPQTAMLSIASRGDLMPVYATAAENLAHYGPLSFFMAQGCFGAIDSKIASYKNRHSLKSYVISGPTNDDQPTFAWNTGACVGNPAPEGTPTVVNYPWVVFNRVKDESA